MEVWIVTKFDDDNRDTVILGVFSTREKAEAYDASLGRPRAYDFREINSYRVDEWPAAPRLEAEHLYCRVRPDFIAGRGRVKAIRGQ
ncbi:hypothetical protein AHiyo6_05810 [Arthrobacter sp. Hiyo6]|nr:hypothetical protein AHiyo6_05810 [Arthrobacter sp. Hiyo6]